MAQANSRARHFFMIATAWDNGDDKVATACWALMQLHTRLLSVGMGHEYEEGETVPIGLSDEYSGMIDPSIAVKVPARLKVSRATKVRVNSEIGLQYETPAVRNFLGVGR